MMNIKSVPFAPLIAAMAALFFVPSPSLAQEAAWAPLITELKEKYPDLAARRKLAKSIGAAAGAKMAWDDPMIELGLMDAPVDGFALDREEMTRKTIGVTQNIPSYGKRLSARNLARAEEKMAEVDAGVMTAELVAELKKSVYELAYAHKALGTLKETDVILEEFVLVANAKYSAGKGLQTDVIKAQVERTRLSEKRLILAEQAGLAKVMINRLLGRDEAADFAVPPELLTAPEALDFEKSWVAASQNSPLLKLAGVNVDRARSMLEKEKAEKGLDMSFMAEYAQREDSPMERPDLFSVKASISVPLWSSIKQDKYIAGAQLGVEEALDRKNDMEKRLRAELMKSALSAKKEADVIKLFRTAILPQATQAFQSAMAAYQQDKVEFLTLLENERMLLEYELELEEAVMRLRSLCADAEAMTGAATTAGGKNE